MQFIIDNPSAGLFYDPGLGKTSTMLGAVAWMKEQGLVDKVLVIAPLLVCHMVWPAEVAKWSDFNHLKVAVLHGPKKAKALKSDADIYVINPEGLGWLLKQYNGTWPWDMLVVDESTKFKSAKAQRTKMLMNVVDLFRRRYILTGTPAPNGIQDLFSQIRILDGGKRLGRYITHFRTRFMMQTGYKGYEYKPKEGALEEIEAELQGIVHRLSAKDWIDLEMAPQEISVTLDKTARKLYRDMERDFLIEAKGKTIAAMQKSSLGMKLRQIANGFIYDEDQQATRLHTAKIDALKDFIEALCGQQVLVLTAFKEDVAMINEALGPVPHLSGATVAGEIQARWASGDLQVLTAHPASAGHGLNLQGACRHVLWYGMTWNLEEYDQACRRVARQGSHHKTILVHHLVIENSIEQRIGKALALKDRTQQHLLDALQKRGNT